ncbi:hypothetical protein CY652_01225 [Burkholderia sp. WAC0059]|uniref:MFS transporter n=1 Tax=Burkholderia sp. WAC0059 TaxID=2066022 RepID=UPI000C7EBD67|nr:MFS transporter [Burkholderia sp. WAC0059]PLZ04324.1 hypothetical protein CY652_01225 [Burkholderia sp. WAC0059]
MTPRLADKYKVLLMIWLLQFVNYLDRINLSLAAPTMMKALSIRPDRFGFVLAAFTAGYALAQIPGGHLADRFGAKRLLVVSPILWSVFTGMTGFVSTFALLIVARVLFGTAEGLSIAPGFKSIGDYFPPHERSTANGVYLSSLALGPAFVAPVAVWLLVDTGWQGMFRWLALPGIVMAVLIAIVMPRAPKRPAAPPPETTTPATPAAAASAPSGGRFAAIARQPAAWFMLVAYLAFNVAFWGYIGWMPSYLAMARHIELKALGFAAAAPYLAGAAGLLAFGWLGSHVLYRQRCLLVAATYAASALCLYLTCRAAGPVQSVIGLSAAGFFLYGGFGPVWSVVLDLTPESLRGAFSGLVNCAGQIGGFFAPIVVGYFVAATSSFTGGFLFMTGALAVGALCFVVLQFVKRDWPARPARNTAAA